jgi:quercetin dioxygenase-like cupin family protein
MKSQFLLAGVAALFAGNVTLAQDPVSVDPKHHKIEFENEQVRVLRITFDPGEKAPMHEHPCAIAVGIRDGALEFTLPDGTSRTAPLTQGQVIVNAKPFKHQVENKSDKPVEVILLEMKTGKC